MIKTIAELDMPKMPQLSARTVKNISLVVLAVVLLPFAFDLLLYSLSHLLMLAWFLAGQLDKLIWGVPPT